jgi:Arc/MetJ-type ribon-helix-helix transcriptional regulator
MIPTKVTLEKSQIDFLAQCKELGFKDKSSVVRLALDLLHQDLLRQRLEESADLYAELYDQDPELQQLTKAALVEWPE